MPSVDPITKSWMRDRSDALAVKNGCRFSVERAAFVVWWIEEHCELYQGASGPLILHSCAKQPRFQRPPDFYGDDGEPIPEVLKHYAARMEWHNRQRAAGVHMDWQFEVTCRLFGWERWSDELNEWIRRFRTACVFVPKKQKKSPSLAAWAMYTMAADGEPGNHVFFGAKDGAQARDIVGEHVKKMVEKLRARGNPHQDEWDINLNKMRISYYPTDSWMQPLTSSNERTKKAKEGLNGSLMIDEVHVVDHDYMGILEGATISRKEPLHIEVSTAGSDPESYGKGRFDYSERVRDGIEPDDTHFVYIAAVPPDVTDEQLKSDPIRYGKLANPSWGHTIRESEFVAAFRKASAGTLSDWMRFQMYRLNRWQHSESPYIDAGVWAACQRDFTPEDCEGLPCVLSLDMARKQDMVAATFTFLTQEAVQLTDDDEDVVNSLEDLLPTAAEGSGDPDEDTVRSEFEVVRQLTYFWLPRQTALRMSRKVPQIMDWAKTPWLTLTNRDVIDSKRVARSLWRKCQRFDVIGIVADQAYAVDVIEFLTQDEEDEDGTLVREGLEIDHVYFQQTWKALAEPTADLENWCKLGAYHHTGNPVLSWQISNAEVKTDSNGNRRIFKPRDSTKKVDGVISAQMGLWGLIHCEEFQATGRFYEDHGLEWR